MGDLRSVRIVLVEPAGPLNVGSVARVMKNFGLTRLVLVSPQCDPLGPEALQMAVHADDVLRAAQQVSSLGEALVGCELAIATTARDRALGGAPNPPETELPHLLDSRFSATALVFGPESRGLNNAELDQTQRSVKIPTSDTYASLNLAQAVAVCCYEISRIGRLPQEKFPWPHPPALSESARNFSDQSADNFARTGRPATLDELEGYYRHLESVLLEIGYLYPHTATSRMRKFRQLVHRAMPSAAEVALLRGVLRQIRWATGQPPDNPRQP